MPSSDYGNAISGGLKMKGAKDAGVKKPKKKKSTKPSEPEPEPKPTATKPESETETAVSK
ncbi:hypothetical protein LTR53_020455, partial [Teratosphaeriaceae sp. CCFEE 6253]